MLFSLSFCWYLYQWCRNQWLVILPLLYNRWKQRAHLVFTLLHDILPYHQTPRVLNVLKKQKTYPFLVLQTVPFICFEKMVIFHKGLFVLTFDEYFPYSVWWKGVYVWSTSAAYQSMKIVSRKSTVGLNYSSLFSTEYHFCLKEQLIDALWFFRQGDLAGMASKQNEGSLQL